jgi:lysozyme
MPISSIFDQLERDEGFAPRPYRDHLGHWTVGYGWNLEDGPSLDRDIARMILRDHVARTVAELRQKLSWADGLSEARFGVLINMGFQLGVGGLLKFEKMLAAAEQGDHGSVVREMLDSRWAKQTPLRARRLADQWMENKWQ